MLHPLPRDIPSRGFGLRVFGVEEEVLGEFRKTAMPRQLSQSSLEALRSFGDSGLSEVFSRG